MVLIVALSERLSMDLKRKNSIVQDFYYFLPREATRRVVLPRQVVRPSVRPSVTLRYRDHIGYVENLRK